MTDNAEKLPDEPLPDAAGANQEVSRIDAPYDPDGIGQVVAGPRGGLVFPDLPAMVEGSKLMARAGIALPPHFRDEPGMCFAILLHCQNWGIRNPIFIANHSYVVTNRQGAQTLAFDAMVFHAVVAASGIVEPTPEYEYAGEGPTRTCTVSFRLRKGGKVVSYTTPKLEAITPKNSPLWTSNPDVQLAYFGIRNLARVYFPLALGGIYDRDEFDPATARDVTPPPTPRLVERMTGRIEGDGFKPDAVQQEAEAQAAIAKAEALKEQRRTSLKAAREAKASRKAPAKAKAAPEQKPSPAASAGPPQTRGEYTEYAMAKIKEVKDPVGWFHSEDEYALRERCKVDKTTFDMLRTLVKEVTK